MNITELFDRLRFVVHPDKFDLEICKGDFNSHHPISDDAKDYLKWWVDSD